MLSHSLQAPIPTVDKKEELLKNDDQKATSLHSQRVSVDVDVDENVTPEDSKRVIQSINSTDHSRKEVWEDIIDTDDAPA